MTSIIEQADAIVGITTDVIMANVKADTYRRGAYASWYAKNSQPDQWPTVAETIESQAERIVRLHKPKGDGLPSHVSFAVLAEGFGDVTSPLKTSFEFCEAMSERERDALATYFRRCLAPPVRRLLAMYDVVGVKPTRDTCVLHVPHVVVDGLLTSWNTQPDICWLVPRGER